MKLTLNSDANTTLYAHWSEANVSPWRWIKTASGSHDWVPKACMC
jgi:hypothetical protein